MIDAEIQIPAEFFSAPMNDAAQRKAEFFVQMDTDGVFARDERNHSVNVRLLCGKGENFLHELRADVLSAKIWMQIDRNLCRAVKGWALSIAGQRGVTGNHTVGLADKKGIFSLMCLNGYKWL